MSCHTEQWNEKLSYEKEWKSPSIYMTEIQAFLRAYTPYHDFAQYIPGILTPHHIQKNTGRERINGKQFELYDKNRGSAKIK